ncbi:pancreatic lipase-related protein 2 [Halyomorpha halys]|uniref:pancreatic lipase-related protein 2 n=1 Tax=Halyomorpha halys TaxID=286706 RepID=UPI0006D5082D|nr:pancreatic lipase-related protein 2 [Halyomorpha halys]
MGLLLVIGVITLCASFIDAGLGDCFFAKDVCPSEHITFWLRTRKTGYEGVVVTEANLDKMPLEDGPLVVLIHGYKGHKEYIPNPDLVKAYLEKGNYNVITVDWGKMAKKPCYHTAVFNTAVAGKCTVRFLQQLYSKRGQHWKQATHVVGFSLGAHVAGILGRHLPGLPRITGLDPALPGFDEHTSGDKSRLDTSDALFVDVYHSNSGFKGRPGCLGHVDFYLNNGGSQPGCNNASCNHHRAVEVFAESIKNPEGFFGKPCEPKVVKFMLGLSKEVCPYSRNDKILVRAGEYVSQKARGSFKFETNANTPFAKGLQKKRADTQII